MCQNTERIPQLPLQLCNKSHKKLISNWGCTVWCIPNLLYSSFPYPLGFHSFWCSFLLTITFIGVLLCLIVQHAAILLGEDLAGGALHILCRYGAVAGELVGEVAVLADEFHLGEGNGAVEVVDVVEGALRL